MLAQLRELIVQIGNAQKKTEQKMAELAESQLKTDWKLDRLIEALHKAVAQRPRIAPALPGGQPRQSF